MRIIDKNRENYKRSFSDGKGCVFCENDEILECRSLTGKFWRVLVNRFPYMDGNLMIIPKKHVEKIEDIGPEEWRDFGDVLAEVKRVLGNIFKTDSFNIGLNLGPQSGASIAHLHWQVVPRKFKNITVMNTFADVYIVATTPEETKRLIDEETGCSA